MIENITIHRDKKIIHVSPKVVFQELHDRIAEMFCEIDFMSDEYPFYYSANGVILCNGWTLEMGGKTYQEGKLIELQQSG